MTRFGNSDSLEKLMHMENMTGARKFWLALPRNTKTAIWIGFPAVFLNHPVHSSFANIKMALVQDNTDGVATAPWITSSETPWHDLVYVLINEKNNSLRSSYAHIRNC